MDEIPKPEVQIIQKAFFQTIWAKILLLILVLTLIASILYFLHSQGILKLNLLEKQTSQNNTSQNTKSSPLPLEKLQITCPVPKEFCDKGVILRDGNTYLGIGYKLSPGTKIYASLKGVATPEISQGDKSKNISNHIQIRVSGTNQSVGYESIYQFFGLPNPDVQSTDLVQNKEIGIIFGGKFPDKAPYNGISLLFYVQTNTQEILQIDPKDLSQNQ